MASILKSPIEDALSKAPSFGLPETFKPAEGRQTAAFTPGNVPYQSEFTAASQRYGVPVNVLMALADQESSFNPTALGQPTKYGRAKGLMQYIDSTAASMGINPYDPMQAIDAAAKQLRTRLDQGYSMQEAVSAHFGGDDRKQWGPKTRAYGEEVLGKAQRYFDGTAAPVKAQPSQGQQQERDWAKDFPAAQSGMENMQQNELRTRAIQMDHLLGELNKDEPDRYRPLTATEMAQVEQGQKPENVLDKQQPQPKQEERKQELPAVDFDKANVQQAAAQNAADTALQIGAQATQQNGGKPQAELRAWEPTLWDRIKGLIPGDRDAAAVELAARRIAQRDGVSVDEVYRSVGGQRPLFNPEGRAPIQALVEGSQVVAKQLPNVPQATANAVLRAVRGGDVPAEDKTMIDRGITATDIPEDKNADPNYSGLQGIDQSLGFTVSNLAPSIAAGLAGNAVSPGVGTAAGFATSGSIAYRSSKDQFLSDVRKMASEKKGSPLTEKEWGDIRIASEAAATRYGAWEAIPEALGNVLALRLISHPLAGASRAAKLADALGRMGKEQAMEQATETATTWGQNKEQRAVGLTNEDLSLGDAFRQQALQTAIVSGISGGAMQGGRAAYDAIQSRRAGTPAADPAAQPEAQAAAAQAEQQAQATEQQAAATEEQAVAATPTPSRDDTGLSDDAGPLERAVRGTAPQPDATNGSFWGGEPGATINMQAKGDPDTAMVVKVERYERDGSMTVRSEDGTPYTVSPDDVDIVATASAPQSTSQEMQDAGTAQEVKDERAAATPEEKPEDAEKRQEAINKALQEQGIDPTTGEVLEEKPARQQKNEEAPAERKLTDMSEEELRDRMRYLASQAKQNGGWDTRLTTARRSVEKVLNARVREREKGATVGDNGLTEMERLRLDEITNKEKRTDAEKAEALSLIEKSNAHIRGDAADGNTVGSEGLTLVHGSGNPEMTADDVQIIRPQGQKQGKKDRVYGGFYGTAENDVSQAEGYASMMGGTPTVYDVRIRPGTKIFRKEGDITRLKENVINDLVSKGYGVVVGTDPRGRTEYAVINKDAIQSLSRRGDDNASVQERETDEQPARAETSAQPVADNSAAVQPDESGNSAQSSGVALDSDNAGTSGRASVSGEGATADASGALTGADGKPKWFSTAEKAQGHIDKKSLTGYKVIEVKPRRFELHRETKQTTDVVAPAQNNQAENATAPAPKSAQNTKTKVPVNPRTNRSRKLVGDVGDIVSPDGDVGYLKAFGQYQITRIEKNGTIHVMNRETASSTTISPGEMEAARSRRVSWSKTDVATAVAENVAKSATMQRSPQQEQAATTGRPWDVNADGRVSTRPEYSTGKTVTLPDGRTGKVLRVKGAENGEYPGLQLSVDVGEKNPVKILQSEMPNPASTQRSAEWKAFTPAEGTLGIPRDQMPQIKAEHRGAMVNFMNARGVQHEEQTVPASSLKPTQAEFSPARVARAAERTEGDRSILVSSDGYILDGHHQWLAARNAGEEVKTIRLDAPIEQLVSLAREFPSSTLDSTSAQQNTENLNQNPEKVNQEAPKAEQTPQNVDIRATSAEDRNTLSGLIDAVNNSRRSLADIGNEMQVMARQTDEGSRQLYDVPDTRSRAEFAAELQRRLDGSTASNEGAKTEAGNSEARPADYGANNKLVSADRAAELRQRLKSKFSQLNSGIDPEILAIGTELAVFHIEASARKFADFAKAMAADLDLPLDRLRPYLRSWYNGARDMMEDSNVSIDGMDNAETVRAEMAKLNTAPAAPAATQTPAPASARTSGALEDMVNTFDSEVSNVSSPRTGLESDRATTGNQAPVSQISDVDAAGRNGRDAAGAGKPAGAERSVGQRDQRVSDTGATAGRESGNQRVYREDGQFGSPEGAARSDIGTRSAGRSESGLSTERSRATAVAKNAHAAGTGDFAQRLAAQKAAPKETKLGDAASVRASLPMLLPAQQDDVVKVEQRHQKDNGILITNGTGTGKTASGMGVAKRFHNAGKDNILIVVPSDKIASDWVKFAGFMDMPLKQLEGITDNGKSGPVITTYANLGQNDALAKREWDLVIPDESHRLMQNEAGDVTDQLRMFRALTGHPDGFSTWLQAKNSEQYAQLVEAQEARDIDAAEGNESAAATKRAEKYQQLLADWNALYKAEQGKWRDRWAKQEGLPKTVFMSATPFAYVPNTDYAEGYLFHHVPPADRFKDRSSGGYNAPDPRSAFYVEHFGYRMRYNRLTRPDAEVNSELMEQNFNQWLKDQGALTGRSLDVPFDYDRKFVLIDDAAGKKLDQALEFLNNGENGQYRDIYRAVMDTFDHQRKMFLLESMKARAVIPVIKEHMALGRKVLVIHDYNQGGGFNPFSESLQKMDTDMRPVARELFQRPLFRINFSGLDSALSTLTRAFPDALTFNGTVPKAKRRAAADSFNDDASGAMLLIAQSDAMREGVSVHDTTGKHQRVTFNLGLPTQPTKAIQLEGRTYRTGQASDAIFRYMTTGTAWEASAFASKLAERASTAENLAMGPESRALKQSFIDAYTNADTYKASPEDGKGGKAADKREGDTISEFEKAKSYYYGQQKNSKSRDSREGVDYYATPEPVGLKMVQWAGIRPGDKVLEPSAGHGAIARFIPGQTEVTMVEPSLNLSQRAALANGGARIVNSRFEDFPRNNKFDAIPMNPPYGMGGKTAYEHLAKAVQHLREGGRIVALLPRGGQADQRFNAFMKTAKEEGLHLIADVAMPRATFERAGTQVNTRILVLDKNTDKEYQAPETQRIDLSGAESVNELFDRIEGVDVNPRAERAAPTATEPQYNDLPEGGTEFAADAMAELAAYDDMFSYPRATGERSLQGVFDTVVPDVKVKWQAPQLDDNSNETGVTHIRGVTGRGRDINIYQTPDEVWFDVSNVNEGEGGAGIYQAVADYALNTGRKFVGDPDGLSDIALRRRTEAMLSSALKHGTTDHLEPHQRQLEGDKALGVPPLRWKEGDVAFNIRSLIDTSLANIKAAIPEIDRARYDFATGTFRTGEGKPLSDGLLTSWASHPRVREARAGRDSLKRAILLNSLARTESGAQSGLLERIYQSGSVRGLDAALTNTFYDWDTSYARLPEGNRIKMTSRLRKLQQQQALGQISPEEYSQRIGELADWLEERTMENAAKRAFAERQRGSDMVLERLHRARRRGDISEHAADIAIWALNRNPQLAEDLGISIREKGGNNYNRVERIARLVSDGNMRDTTPIHEILHHTERMMPPGIQRGIAAEYTAAWKRAYNKASPELRAALDNMRLANFGDKKAQEATTKAFESGLLQYHQHYQLTNASEYWAVNAAEIMANRHMASTKGWVARARQWLSEFTRKLKSVFGLQSDAAVLRGLKAVLDGDGSFQSKNMLAMNPYADSPVRNVQGDYADMPTSPSGMDPAPDIPTPAEDNARVRSWWDKLKNLPADKMTDAMDKGLAVVPMRPLVLELGRNLPAAREYMRLKQSMDAMRSEWHARTDAVAQRWLKYRKSNKDENARLMELMHDATLAQVDPSERFTARMTDRDRDALRTVAAGSERELELVSKAAEDDRRREQWEKMAERFKELSPEAQQLFQDVRNEYTAIANEYEKVLMGNMEKAIDVRIKKAEREHRYELQRITDEGLTGQAKDDAVLAADRKLKIAKTKTAWNRKARITQLRQQFEMERLQGPYFPLARFGNLFVTVRDAATGKVESFSRFEKAAEQREFAELMRKDPKYTVQVGTLDDTGSARKAVDANFVADVEDILADLPNAEQVKDEVWQRYLESLPDFSIRKNRIHRTGRKGFIADALRAYGSQMFHSSHQLARLKHTFDMEESLDAAREEAQKSKDPVRDGKIVNEMEKRHEFVMNPKGGALVQVISQASFIYFLAASPKAAIVNLSQTAIMGVPMLAAYDGSALGMTRAANQLMRAMGDFTRGRGHAQDSKRLTDDERKAMQEAYDTGLIDRTQSHDLAGIGETGVEYSPARTRVMALMAWGFHQGERLNREVTYLAAYRMAKAKGLSHAAAVQAAGDLTWKTHFDYQNTSRPRLMHSDTMKALLVFRNFSINMLWRLFRDIHQATKGDSPEVRKEARIQLAGTTGMMMLNAGLTGTWFFGIAMMLAGMFMDKDKDPEAELKKNMIEALGPRMAGIVLDGVPGYLTGTSLSDSIGMRDLWFRDPSTSLEGKGAMEYWKSQILGAPPSIVDNWIKGYQMIQEGQVFRGIETIMPKFIKDPMKAYRYATEGATNKRGDTIVQDIDVGDVIRQALGFTPAKLAEQYDLNNAGYAMQQSILDKRKKLMDAYWKADEADDTAKMEKLEADIDAYNDKYPEMVITPKSLNRSAKTREQNAENATGGMRYNPKLRERILEDQSPTIYR